MCIRTPISVASTTAKVASNRRSGTGHKRPKLSASTGLILLHLGVEFNRIHIGHLLGGVIVLLDENWMFCFEVTPEIWVKMIMFK